MKSRMSVKDSKNQHEAVSAIILSASVSRGIDWWKSLGTIPSRYPYSHEHIVKAFVDSPPGSTIANIDQSIAIELLSISQSAPDLPPVICADMLNTAWLEHETAVAIASGDLDRIAEVLEIYKEDKQAKQGSYFGSFNAEQIQAGRYILSQPPELDFIFERTLLSGTTGVLVGPAGAGKSTLLNQIILSVATGETIIPEFVPTRPGKVLAIFCEEDDIILHHRMHAIASHFYPPSKDYFNFQPHQGLYTVHKNVFVLPAMGHDVRLLELGRDKNPTKTREFDGLLSLAMKIPDLRLIVLDPFSRLYGQNENDPSMTTYFVSLVEHLSAKTKATSMLSHHTGKASSTNASNGKFDIEKALHQDAARGSSGIPAAVRWQCNMVPLPGRWAKDEFSLDKQPADGQYVGLKVAKLNYGPPQRPFFLKKVDGGVLEPFDFKPSEEEIQRRESIEKAVYEILAEHDCKLTKRTVLDTFASPLKDSGIIRSREDLSSVINMMILHNKIFIVCVKNGNNRKHEYLSMSQNP